MDVKTSYSVVYDPRETQDDLTRLAGRWSYGIRIKVTRPAKVLPGPIKMSSGNVRSAEEISPSGQPSEGEDQTT